MKTTSVHHLKLNEHHTFCPTFADQRGRGAVLSSPTAEVVAMPPPGGCARGGGQWAGTHGSPRSVPARRVEEDNGTR